MNLTIWPGLALAIFAVQYRTFLRLHPSGKLGFVKYLLLVLLAAKLAQVGFSASVPFEIGGFEMQRGGFSDGIGVFLADFMATPPLAFIALFLIIVIELVAGVSARGYLWMQPTIREAVHAAAQWWMQPNIREAVHAAAAQWWANLVVFVAVPVVVFGGVQLLLASGVIRESAPPPSWNGSVFSADLPSSEARPIHIYDFVVPAMRIYNAPQRILWGATNSVGLNENRQAPQLNRHAVVRDVINNAAPWFLLSGLLALFGLLNAAPWFLLNELLSLYGLRNANAPAPATPSRPKVRDLLIGTAFGAAESADSASRLARLPWRGKAVLAFGFGLVILGVSSVLIEAFLAQFVGIVGGIKLLMLLGVVVLFLIFVGAVVIAVVIARHLGRKR